MRPCSVRLSRSVRKIRSGSAALLFAVAVLANAAKPAPKPKPPPLTPEQRAAQAILKPLSLRDRVAQLVIGVVSADPVSSTSTEFEKWHHWVHWNIFWNPF